MRVFLSCVQADPDSPPDVWQQLQGLLPVAEAVAGSGSHSDSGGSNDSDGSDGGSDSGGDGGDGSGSGSDSSGGSAGAMVED